jgi:hypothetical protein
MGRAKRNYRMASGRDGPRKVLGPAVGRTGRLDFLVPDS